MTKLRLTPLYWKSNIRRWDWLLWRASWPLQYEKPGWVQLPRLPVSEEDSECTHDKSMAVTKKYLLFEKLDKGKVLCKSRPALCRLEECQHLRFSKLLSRLKFWPEAYIVTMAPWSIMMVVKPWVWKLLGRGLQGCSNRGQVPVYHFISISISLRVMQAFLTE